jgi:hypothetical protein
MEAETDLAPTLFAFLDVQPTKMASNPDRKLEYSQHDDVQEDA